MTAPTAFARMAEAIREGRDAEAERLFAELVATAIRDLKARGRLR